MNTGQLRTLERVIDATFGLLHEHLARLAPEDLEAQLDDLERMDDLIGTADRRAVWHLLGRCVGRVRIALEACQHPGLEACRRREASLLFLAGE
jgi:hypothetical protein